MPYLKIQSNQSIDDQQVQNLLATASRTVADKLGKPEQYVMVSLDPVRPMLFAGSDAPAVFMELKSIGLSESQTPALSKALCELANETFGAEQNRIYIEFADAQRKMWGWNGATF